MVKKTVQMKVNAITLFASVKFTFLRPKKFIRTKYLEIDLPSLILWYPMPTQSREIITLTIHYKYHQKTPQNKFHANHKIYFNRWLKRTVTNKQKPTH